MVLVMVMKVTIDKAGRLVVPKEIRDRLQIRPGDELEIEAEGDAIHLRHPQQEAVFQRERGLWTFRGGDNDVDVVDWTRKAREQRGLDALRPE